MIDNEHLLKIVNASGFAFQLHIEDKIRNSQAMYLWKVLSSEHLWLSKAGNDQFIDIVLGSLNDVHYRAVIECKRTQDANWIFLISDKKNHTIDHSALLYTKCFKDNSLAEYYNFRVCPGSLESNFCTIRGSSDTDKPMLEKLSAHLIESVESLANQELDIYHERPIFYFPIIVTNANLFTCCFDPNSVDPDSGKLKLDQVKLETVDFIRFRKTLPSRFNLYLNSNFVNDQSSKNLTLINYANERTVFIVKSTSIVDFLESLEIAGEYPELLSRL